MAISSTTSELSFIGNASDATPYPLTGLRYDDNAWLTVTEIQADGSRVPLTEGIHYTLTGDGKESAGSLTSTTGNEIPATSTLNVARNTPATQLSEFENDVPLNHDALEDALDKRTMAAQDSDRKKLTQSELDAELEPIEEELARLELAKMDIDGGNMTDPDAFLAEVSRQSLLPKAEPWTYVNKLEGSTANCLEAFTVTTDDIGQTVQIRVYDTLPFLRFSAGTTPDISGITAHYTETEPLEEALLGLSVKYDSGATYPRVTVERSSYFDQTRFKYFANAGEYPSSPSAQWYGVETMSSTDGDVDPGVSVTATPSTGATGTLTITKTEGEGQLYTAILKETGPAADGTTYIAPTSAPSLRWYCQKIQGGGPEESPIVPVIGNLRVESYTQTSDTTHVHVTFHETPFLGWKFLMSHTPMPANPLEYPSIAVSQDGETWVVPNGCPTPLTNTNTNSPGNTYQHFADTHHVITPEGKLRVYWIAANDSDPKRHGLLAIESSDLINWELLGSDGFILEVTGHNLTSPSVVVLPDNSYAMFASETTNGARDLRRWTSADGITWVKDTSLCTVPANFRVWHANIQLIDGTYHLLGLQNYPSTRPGSGLTYLTSSDGLTWTGDPERYLHVDDYTAEPKAFAGGGYYRSGFRLREDGLFDLWMVTLLSDGSGDGDTSGDYVGAPGLYNYRRLAFARGVDFSKQSRWQWMAAQNINMISPMVADPTYHGTGQQTEKVQHTTNTKGLQARWASTFSTGLLSGSKEDLLLGEKPWLLSGTNKGIGAFTGRLEVSGVLGTVPAAAILVSGTTTVSVLSELNAGEITMAGATEWAIILNTTNPPSPALDALPQAGDTLEGATSGCICTIHKVTQTGRVLFPMKPQNRNVFSVGEQLKLNGVTLTADSTPVTISSFQKAPTTNGIAVLCHFYEASNPEGEKGGFIEIWNTSAQPFHGQISFDSYR